jgi:hypothetical protein
MDMRILLAGEADITNLASLPCISYRLDRPAASEYTLRKRLWSDARNSISSDLIEFSRIKEPHGPVNCFKPTIEKYIG